MRKNKIVLTICGMEFSILSDDSVEYVKATGRAVDEKIKGLVDNNNRLSVAMAAIVAALDYCDELQKTNGSIDNLRAEIKQYLEESAAYRHDAEEARREVERLKRELQNMRIRAGERDPHIATSQAAKLPTPPVINNVPKTAAQPAQPVQQAQPVQPMQGVQPPIRSSHPVSVTSNTAVRQAPAAGTKSVSSPAKVASKSASNVEPQQATAVRKPRLYGKDAFAESADVEQEIMNFFRGNND